MSSSIEQTVMYSQLQPWSQAGAPPCLEQISGPMVPTRIGTYFKVSLFIILRFYYLFIHSLNYIMYYVL